MLSVKVCKNNSIKFHNIYVNNFTSTALKIFYVQFPSEIKGRSKKLLCNVVRRKD